MVSLSRGGRRRPAKPSAKRRPAKRRNDDKPTIVILLGAGAVVDAGLPTSVELARRFHAFLVDRMNDERYRSQLELHRFLEGGIRFQRGMLAQDPSEPVNIEHLATACLRLKARLDNPVTPYVSGWNQRLIELEKATPGLLDDYTTTLFGRLRDELKTPPDEAISYLTNLADFQKEGHLEICSLNYDLCFERAFNHIMPAKFVNGFTEEGWQPSVFELRDEWQFLKMHGSLDWVEHEEFGICSLECPRHRHAEDLEGQLPLVIFGTDTKLTGKDPFLTLLYRFSRTLEKASLLVTIGYSFSDDYVNEIISQRFAANTRLSIVAVGKENVPKCLEGVSALRGSPRVATMTDGAKTVLEQKTLLQTVRAKLRENASAEPF